MPSCRFRRRPTTTTSPSPCPASGLLIHGEQDTLVPVASVDKLANKLSSQKTISIDYRILPGADHFFTEKLDALTTAVDDYLVKSLRNRAA